MIINQNGVNVNIFLEKEGGTQTEIKEKWTAKKAAGARRAETMKRAGFYTRAERIELCGKEIHGYQCRDCGHFEVSRANFCRDRMCPLCNWRLSMKRFAKMLDIARTVREEEPGGWEAVTLTVKNCPVNKLTETINEMMKAWNCCMSNREMKEVCAGWARSLEITYNHKTRTFHPHFHVILVKNGSESAGRTLVKRWLNCKYTTAGYMAQETHEIKSRWEENAAEHIIDDVTIHAILEAYKYAVKEQPDEDGKTVDDMPVGAFRKLVEGIDGRRLVAFGGVIKYWAKVLEAEDLDNIDDEAAEDIGKVCRKCGSTDVIEMVAEWTNGAYKWREML